MKSRKQAKYWLIPIAILVVIAIIISISIRSCSGEQKPSSQPESVEDEKTVVEQEAEKEQPQDEKEDIPSANLSQEDDKDELQEPSNDKQNNSSSNNNNSQNTGKPVSKPDSKPELEPDPEPEPEPDPEPEPEPEPIGTVDPEAGKSFKVLAIGNSFSRDVVNFIERIAEQEGATDVVVATLYYGGGSLQNHVDNANSEAKAYIYYENANGIWSPSLNVSGTENNNASLLDGIKAQDWDIVTLQQASTESGSPETLNENIDFLVDYVKDNCSNENVRFAWHMTWAYMEGALNFDYTPFENQAEMYKGIVDALKEKIIYREDMSFFIPAGTAVQNARTSYFGDYLTEWNESLGKFDTIHLNELGELVAGYTWYASLTDTDPLTMTAEMGEMGLTDNDYDVIREAAANALKKPYEVTESAYSVMPAMNTEKYSLYDYGQQMGYWKCDDASGGHDTVWTASAENEYGYNFIATQRFTKDTLPVGSVIEVDPGYKVRIEKWEGEGPSPRGYETSPTRMKITEEFWANYKYVAFNLSTSTPSSFKAVNNAASHLRIWIPQNIDTGATLKVLAIGNSFSHDAMSQLYKIAKAEGMDNVVLGNLYYGGCTLGQHLDFAKNNKPLYNYYKDATGKWTINYGTTMDYGLLDQDWDIITIQQGSKDSGMPATYNEDLTALVDYVTEKVPDAKLYWHMTWAYHKNYSNTNYTNNYSKNQLTMYNAIADTVEAKIVPLVENGTFEGIIPAGTAIQNVRSSYLSDNFNSDGLHLNDMGDYIAGYVWYNVLTGKTPAYAYTRNDFYFSDTEYKVFKESIENALTKPYEVTQSAYDTAPAIDYTKFVQIPLSGQSGYYNSTTNTTVNEGDTAFGKTYVSTERFTLDNLPYGSIVVLDEGWSVRMERWNGEGKSTLTRKPADDVGYRIINGPIVEGAKYIGFNLNKSGDLSSDIQGALSHLKVYVPISVLEKDYVEVTSKELGYYYPTGSHLLQTSASISKNYLGFTPRFNAATLPEGSIISIVDGYQARVRSWVKGNSDVQSNSHITITGAYKVPSDFFNGYTCRGVYVCAPNANVNMTNNSDKARIFIPKDWISKNYTEVDITLGQGYWSSNNTSGVLGNDSTHGPKNIGVFPKFTKETLPVGSMVVLEDGYEAKSRMSKATGTSGGSEITDIEGAFFITESFWKDCAYRTFHYANLGYTNLSSSDYGKIKIYIPKVSHTKLELSYENGYWYPPGTAIGKGASVVGKNIAITTRFTPETLPVGSIIEVADGYTVKSRSWNGSEKGPEIDGITGTYVVDASFWSGCDHRGLHYYNGSTIGEADYGKVQIYVPK